MAMAVAGNDHGGGRNGIDNRELLKSTDVREPRTATGSRMLPFMTWFCSLPRAGKSLVDDCGLKLRTRWRENAPTRKKFKFRLPSAAQKRLCLSSLLMITGIIVVIIMVI